MIDMNSESLFSLSKAARMLPVVRGNKPPHPATLYRWATSGLRATSGKKIYLETVFVGGTRMTSKEALTRLFERKNDVQFVPLPPSEEKQRAKLEKQADAAIALLRQRGMI